MEQTIGHDAVHSIYTGEIFGFRKGITKREYFSALALQNLQNVFLRKSQNAALEKLKEVLNCDRAEQVLAKLAVIQADALIEALNNE